MSGDYFGSIGALEAARAARRKAVQEWGKETLAEADRALTGGVYAEDWDIFEDFEDEDEDTADEVEFVEAPKEDPTLDWIQPVVTPATVPEPVAIPDEEPVVVPDEEPVIVEANAPKLTSKRATTSK